MTRFFIYIISFSMLLIILTASSAPCEEYSRVYGNETIFKDTTWSGKVLIQDIVTVFADVTLTIEPGTVIMFEKRDTNGDGFGENEIYIQGEVIAIGTRAAPIIFTSAEKVKRPGDWGAINMMISEDKRNIFSNCVLEYSYRGFHAHFSAMNLVDCEIKNNFLAVQFQDSKVTIKGCNIHDNNQGMQFRDSTLLMEGTNLTNNNIGIRCVYSEVDFRGNEISGSSMTGFRARGSTVEITGGKVEGCRSGITAQDSSITVKGSMILNNMEDGLSLHNSDTKISGNIIMLNGDDGIFLENTTAVINNNNIFNNAKYNVSLEQPGGVDAKNNYWGTDDPDKLDEFNFDKKDSGSLGEIDIGGYFDTEIHLTE